MVATLAAYLHDIDPYAIRIWEGRLIRWYGLSYLAGFLVAYLIIKRIAQLGNSPLKVKQVGDLVMALAVGVVVGGRLGYVVFYQPSLLVTFTGELPYWQLLAINQGGMASHGGLIGLVAASLWYARRNQILWRHVIDLAAFALPIGLFFGRVANFVNGELYGRRCADDFALAVKFPQEMQSWDRGRLDQLSSVVERVGIRSDEWQAALSSFTRSSSERISYAVSQLIERVQAGDAAIADALAPLITARHPSQLYQASLEGLFLFVVLAWAWSRPRKPGMIFALGGVVYSLVRIVAEQFRQPDVHIANLEFAQLGVTRGQWLSAILLAVSLAAMLIFARSNAAPLGGWKRKLESQR